MQKKSQKEFIEELGKINPDIEVVSEYIAARFKVKCRCRIDGHEWEATGNNLLRGRGCSLCGIRKTRAFNKKTNEDFITELSKINKDIEPLDVYTGSSIKIRCRCRLDAYEWEATPNNLLRGKRCPRCANSERYTPQDFRKKMESINSNIEILGDYKKSQEKIRCRCKIDGYEWDVIPNSLVSGSGCPECSSSKGESMIRNVLTNLGVYFETEKTFSDLYGDSGWNLRFDFYIPNYNLLIEYQGAQHKKPFGYFGGTKKLEKQKRYDERKRIYAKEHNIDFLEIWYWDFDSIEEIIKNKLR